MTNSSNYDSPTVPEWDKLGVPVDDDAESDEAETRHNVPQGDVDYFLDSDNSLEEEGGTDASTD